MPSKKHHGKKKRGRLVGVGRDCFLRKISQIASSVFDWHSYNSRFLRDYFYVDFRFIKESSEHHFHFTFVFKDRYVNNIFKKWNFWKEKILSVDNCTNFDGKITLGHFPGHNTVILFISIESYKDKTKRLLPVRFSF